MQFLVLHAHEFSSLNVCHSLSLNFPIIFVSELSQIWSMNCCQIMYHYDTSELSRNQCINRCLKAIPVHYISAVWRMEGPNLVWPLCLLPYYIKIWLIIDWLNERPCLQTLHSRHSSIQSTMSEKGTVGWEWDDCGRINWEGNGSGRNVLWGYDPGTIWRRTTFPLTIKMELGKHKI